MSRTGKGWSEMDLTDTLGGKKTLMCEKWYLVRTPQRIIEKREKWSLLVVSDSLQLHELWPARLLSVRGIFQARILEWVAISYSRGSSDPEIKPGSPESPALAGRFFTTNTTWQEYWRYSGIEPGSPALQVDCI